MKNILERNLDSRSRLDIRCQCHDTPSWHSLQYLLGVNSIGLSFEQQPMSCMQRPMLNIKKKQSELMHSNVFLLIMKLKSIAWKQNQEEKAIVWTFFKLIFCFESWIFQTYACELTKLMNYSIFIWEKLSVSLKIKLSLSAYVKQGLLPL